MARNIVNDYIEYDRKYLREYIDTITEKKLVSKICDMIVDTYINVRYYDIYEHVKKYPIDNIEYYVIENFKKLFSDKNKEKNIPLIVNALIILRYVILYEKYSNNKSAVKQLTSYEDKLKDKFNDTDILVSSILKSIKDNTRKKEKFLNGLLSNEFSVIKENTNIKNVYNMYFDNNVKIPDLFSEVAIDRVYNSGIIAEDKMIVFYILTAREVLQDMINYQYDTKYLVSFPSSLIGKRNKLNNLSKVIDSDYLKERIILKVLYSDYLTKKDEYDDLIRDGYSLAIIIDDEISDNVTLLNIFMYIIIDDEKYIEVLKKFDNVILLK